MYAFRCRGVAGSPVNQYAPFYFWVRGNAISVSCLTRGLRGCARHSGGHGCRIGLDSLRALGPRLQPPRAASKFTFTLGPDDDLHNALASDRHVGPASTTPGLHSTALVLDPTRWELVRFSLWHEQDDESEGTRYEVLHVSAPGLESSSPKGFRTAT